MSSTGEQREATSRPTSQGPQVSGEEFADVQVEVEQPPAGSGAGWRAFAGIMLLVVGFFNFIDALVGLTNATYFRHVANGYVLPITNNVHTWGWVELVFSIVLLFAGLGVLSMGRALISRTIGVVVAGVNMVFQLAYLAHFPFWSFTMIIVDILIVYGLVRRVDAYEV